MRARALYWMGEREGGDLISTHDTAAIGSGVRWFSRRMMIDDTVGRGREEGAG
jgi:hypothetical protein